MARPIFEIAKSFQDKIFGDLEQAQSFKDNARDSVLADFRIPEELSKTRLNNTNNQFDLQNRLNTFNTDLEKNRLSSQLDLKTTQEGLSTFDEESKLREITRQNKMEAEKAAREKYVFLADNAGLRNEKLKLEVEAENARNRAVIEESMNSFEKYQAENEYNSVIDEIGDWATLPQGQRVMLAWDKAKGKNISRKGLELIKLKLREELSDEVATLKYFDELLFEKYSATTKADAAKYNAMANKFKLSLRGLDTQTLAYAISKGILKASDFNPMLFEAIVSATDPAAQVPQLADIPDANGQPVPEPAPTADQPPAAPTAEQTQPAPAPLEPAPAPAQDLPPPPVLTVEEIAASSDMTTEEVNAAFKGMTGEAQQVLLTIPTTPKEALDLLSNLESLGTMFERTENADTKELLMRIVANRMADVMAKYAPTN